MENHLLWISLLLAYGPLLEASGDGSPSARLSDLGEAAAVLVVGADPDFSHPVLAQKLKKAVTEGGRVRFRPVMLTTVSTICGLLPLTFLGGSLWGPMVNVIIFGLSLATLLTLVIVPVLYEAFERKS